MKMKSRVAILYICTGQYSIFWNSFYTSAIENLFPSFEKHFFVFTDDQSIVSNNQITNINKQSKGFPADSLFRYHYFLEIKDLLKEYDFIYFFNANTKFARPIGDEFLPSTGDHNGLVVASHAGYVNKNLFFYPYERSKDSKAYVPYRKKASYGYYWGGINGGVASAYLNLCETLVNWIDDDKARGKIVAFHDESYFNRYIHLANPQVMSSSFGWPEDWIGIEDPKIIILDKVRIDINFKKQPDQIFPRILGFIKRLISGIIWRFGN